MLIAPSIITHQNQGMRRTWRSYSLSSRPMRHQQRAMEALYKGTRIDWNYQPSAQSDECREQNPWWWLRLVSAVYMNDSNSKSHILHWSLSSTQVAGKDLCMRRVFIRSPSDVESRARCNTHGKAFRKTAFRPPHFFWNLDAWCCCNSVRLGVASSSLQRASSEG